MADVHGAERSDLIVVGGGLYGASILFHAARLGIGGLLLERHHLAEGPTGRSSGNIRLHYTTPELAEIAWRSFAVTDDFAAQVGGDNGFMRVGVLYGVAPEDAAAFETNAERLAARGEPIETRTPAEVAELVPGFDLAGIALGVWEPRSGYADPEGTTLGFAEAATRLGARIRVRTPVAAIETDGGRVTGVRTADGQRIEAGRVVVAAGPWSRQLLAGVGVELPTFPERHAITLLDAAGDAKAVVPCVFSDRPNGVYARPEGEALVLLGGTTSRTLRVDDGDTVDASVPLGESGEHVGRASSRVPALGGLGIRPGYASVYDMSPDSFPIMDAVPGIEGLFVAAGTSGHGFKLAPALGGLMAELVAGRRDPLLRPFRLDRSFGPTGEISM